MIRRVAAAGAACLLIGVVVFVGLPEQPEQTSTPGLPSGEDVSHGALPPAVIYQPSDSERGDSTDRGDAEGGEALEAAQLVAADELPALPLLDDVTYLDSHGNGPSPVLDSEVARVVDGFVRRWLSRPDSYDEWVDLLAPYATAEFIERTRSSEPVEWRDATDAVIDEMVLIDADGETAQVFVSAIYRHMNVEMDALYRVIVDTGEDPRVVALVPA